MTISGPLPPIVNPNLYVVMAGVKAASPKVANTNAKNVAALFIKALKSKAISAIDTSPNPM